MEELKQKKDIGELQKKHCLQLLCFGGGIGTVSGMHIFRHKTKKTKFTIGLPTILIAEICLAIYFIFFYK